ncbi:MAG: hypothetical protein WAN65_01780 [Candidatus Sulfotelmatobacter sp.]
MSKLTYGARKQLSTSTFAVVTKGAPGKPAVKKYPIPDASHARNAEARVAQFGTAAEKAKVHAAVHRKFPSIGKTTG